MIRTRVGYSGGENESPTYRDLGDHSESIQIDYDPARISYEKLLGVFWNSHNPCLRSLSTQYRTAVFYHSEEQRRIAMVTRAAQARSASSKIKTEVLPATHFHLAEPRYQKHRLRNDRALMRLLEPMFPDFDALVRSTLAARLNAYLAGYVSLESIRHEISALDGDPAPGKALLAVLEKRV